MHPTQPALLFTALLAATKVAAHGHVTNVVVNGVFFQGFDINKYPYRDNPPKVAGWTTPNFGNGFVAVDQLGSDNIICHQNATNAQASIPVKAGDRMNLQWTEWPESHHGPVVDYLARCDGSCTTVDKTTLEFFKIDGVGLVDDSEAPGIWGDDQMIMNNNSWMVEIPKSIAPGSYVLRHELIALHEARDEGKAQMYPQCFNLEVSGSGSHTPAGVKGKELYTSTGEGMIVDIYAPIDSYVVPGPSMYSGAVSITQTTSKVTSTGTAIAGTGTATNAIDSPSSSKLTAPTTLLARSSSPVVASSATALVTPTASS